MTKTKSTNFKRKISKNKQKKATKKIIRKIFTDEVQKLSADVCLYVHAVGRIKPIYVSLSVLCGATCASQKNFTKLELRSRLHQTKEQNSFLNAATRISFSWQISQAANNSSIESLFHT